MEIPKVLTYVKGFLRFWLIIINNLYCIPTHCLWMIFLWPLQWFSPKWYLTIESFGFQWLLGMVSSWSWTAGYGVVEMGDEIEKIINDKSLLLINHQSTSDVPLIMAALDGHTGACRNIMWIMDKMFLRTNFGIVSWFHKDFFISSGKEHRDKSLIELTKHLAHVYVPCQRTWILLFPEGGFLHKRREISRKFALKNNLPSLNYVTIPRVGAVQNVVASLGASQRLLNGNSNHCKGAMVDSQLKWIIDLTIAYPNGKPLDIMTIFCGIAPSCNTVFHYRCYPILEVPTDDELLKQWVYDRYIEKESMLETYYKTGKFPDHRNPDAFCQPRLVLHDGTRALTLHLLYFASTVFHYHLLSLLLSYFFF